MAGAGRSEGAYPFLAGLALGGGAAALWSALRRKRRLDPRIVRAMPRAQQAPMVVFVPGLLGSQLLRKDGSIAWLNLGNTLGHHDLTLPGKLPFAASRDELVPGFLIGTDSALPRAFGFTEYADLLELLDAAGYEPGAGAGLRYAVYTYDWRRDIVEAARGLAMRLEGLAHALGDDHARFHLVGHSMGGLVVRYFLRYGGAEPDPAAGVTWAGAQRVASVVLTATPNAGSIPALGAILLGERVGLSHTTLASAVVGRMPSVYQLLPPLGSRVLVDAEGRDVDSDLLDPATWERFGWGPFRGKAGAALADERAFLEAALERARVLQAGLSREPEEPCPVPVYAIGGDCLPTLGRAIVGEGARGSAPRLLARSGREQDLLFEPGDGRVTRASFLAAHLAGSDDPEGHGIPELSGAFFGSADHHGLYGDLAFQSLLLRLLARRPRLRTHEPRENARVSEEPGVAQELRGVIETLRRRDQQYRLLAEQAADGVLLVGADGRLGDASPGASVLLARPRGQLLKLPLAELVEPDKAVDDVSALLSLKLGQRLTRTYRLRRPKGGPIEVEVSGRRLAGGRLQLALRDIGERRRAADALRESEDRYERLAASAPDAIVIEASGRVVLANPALRRMLGLQPSAAVAGRALGDFVHPDERPEVARAAAAAAAAGPAGVRLSSRLRRADGSTAEVEGAATVVTYRGRPAVQFLLREVRDERPAAQGDVYRDALTGLTSALIAPDRLSVAIAQAYRHRARVGLVHVDLDEFGSVDTRLGRPVADRLLRAVARRLMHCVRQGDTAARLGQDSFVLVLPGLHHSEDATRIGEKVLRALRKPFPVSEGALSLTASVGISVFPEDGEDAPALLASAERSAARAHEKGGDRIESSAPPPGGAAWDAVELEAGLRAALASGTMSLNGQPTPLGVLHYQPIFAAGSGKILGVEALLRWQHPQLGLVFPQHFLSNADFTGLILAIGPWILQTAAGEVREWQRSSRGLRLAVNLSPPQLMQRTLPDEVKAALEATGFPKQLLQLEVPEGHVVSDLPRSLDMLHRLKALGVQLVLDRFAVRYSSLGRLSELPLDGVKLDLAFLRGPSSNPEDVSLLTAVTAVARGLKLRVCAQGVESQAQLRLLEQLGCVEFQGFHLGPPVPPMALAEQLGRGPAEARR